MANLRNEKPTQNIETAAADKTKAEENQHQTTKHPPSNETADATKTKNILSDTPAGRIIGWA